jgi:hypothetical protein
VGDDYTLGKHINIPLYSIETKFHRELRVHGFVNVNPLIFGVI